MTPDYAALPDPEAADAITRYVREWDAQERLKYAQIGILCLAVQKRLLWQHVPDPDSHLPCRSFARWLRVVAPHAYSTAYAALRDVEELADVPEADLAQVPQSNFKTLRQLSTAVRRDPEVLKAAKGTTESLVAHVKQTHPDQHVDSPARMVLSLTEGGKSEIEEAVRLAIERGDAHTKEDAVLMWAISYQQDCQNALLADEERRCGHA